MALSDYEYEMTRCFRCSHCKFVPWPVMKSHRFSQGCPSVARFNFHAYSASGKIEVGLAVHQGRIKEWTEEMLDVVYRCQLCGACQVACQPNNYLLVNVEEIIQELRSRAIEEGQIIPEHSLMIEGMKKEDNPYGEPKEKRGDWAEGLGLKDLNQEKAEVIFHAGCTYSYDEDLRDVVRGAATLLREANVDVGTFGKSEACCGGRAYEIGFKGEMENFREDMASRIKASGAKILVTPCADCYGTFNQTYSLTGHKLEGIEVLHITEYLDRLLGEGKLKPNKGLDMKVTYHDPCHLGRKGEVIEPWKGEWKLTGPHIYEPVPGKPFRVGSGGCFDPPRNVIKSIPGIELVEMERIREYSWCCGAGGGVWEAYPDFAHWTAMERIEEAKATGAEALVTACPWCVRNFKEALEEAEEEFPVYDIIELMLLAKPAVKE
jgi:Fe-S oxidoreductase